MTTRARDLIDTIEDVFYDHKVLDEIIIFDPGTDAAHRLDEGKWSTPTMPITTRITPAKTRINKPRRY
jgi:hypothetical protein